MERAIPLVRNSIASGIGHYFRGEEGKGRGGRRKWKREEERRVGLTPLLRSVALGDLVRVGAARWAFGRDFEAVSGADGGA